MPEMTVFESEIQELIYGMLTEDALLSTCLGGDAIDKRIGLSFRDSETQKISASKAAFIVIETMPAPAPVRLGSGIDDRTERYCLHIFSRPEGRDLRAFIEGRLRELFHKKSFLTAQFIVYDVHEGERNGVITEAGLFDYRYTISFQFLPKGN
jgi:hypothetical protein